MQKILRPLDEVIQNLINDAKREADLHEAGILKDVLAPGIIGAFETCRKLAEEHNAFSLARISQLESALKEIIRLGTNGENKPTKFDREIITLAMDGLLGPEVSSELYVPNEESEYEFTIYPAPDQAGNGLLVNTQYRGVQMKHIPTGIVIRADKARSQRENRNACITAIEKLLNLDSSR